MKRCLLSALAVGLCLSANVMAQVPSYVPTNGLVGWWPFNGNANDESGNGNNGTVNGATLTADRFGNSNAAHSFSPNSYIEVLDVAQFDFALQNQMSISFWMKATIANNPSTIDRIPISKQTGVGVSQLGWNTYIENTANYLGMVVKNGSTGTQGYYGVSNLEHLDGNWHLFSSTFNNGLCSIYIDNILINTSITSGVIIGDNSGNLRFGQVEWASFYAYTGQLDDIGIWNRVLTECEIQDLYNAQINSVAGSIIISPQPASIGSNINLSTATNSTNVQWQSNPSNFGWQNIPSNLTYSDGTTNTLTVNNVQLANHNQPFRVIASAGNCSDTSNVATIQIADTCITNVTVYDTLLTTVTDTLIINTTLGLPSPNNENTILIYPNPASDHITIDNGNYTAMAGYTIKIENNAGQQVFQSLINQAQFYVDLSTWSGNGLYFVHLIDAQGNTVTVRKIVLQ